MKLVNRITEKPTTGLVVVGSLAVVAVAAVVVRVAFGDVLNERRFRKGQLKEQRKMAEDGCAL